MPMAIAPMAVRNSAGWRALASCFALRRHTATAPAVARVGVVGSGQMGTGIAIVAARHAGLEVCVFDKFEKSLEASKKFTSDWAAKEVKKGRLLEQERPAFERRLTYGLLDNPDAMSAVAGLDFVIEAVSEDIAVKRKVFDSLQAAGLAETSILASNTSSISITKLAANVQRPERVIGMHFMNPVPVMPLVEVIRGLRTDDETLSRTLSLCSAMRKEHATSEDRPGFVANRILMPYINEAIFVLQEGIATAEDIDKTMRLGTNVPMGPLTLADFIGLDTCLSIMQVLHNDLGDSKYRPAALLVNYVEAGWLGKKTKRGFYKY